LINYPVCSEEREEEYERAKRRIFNEMMSPAPHYKYSISLGGTKVGGTGIVKLGDDPNTRAVEARLIYSSKTSSAFLVQKDWWIFAAYINR
jgi:hypothetical protein